MNSRLRNSSNNSSRFRSSSRLRKSRLSSSSIRLTRSRSSRLSVGCRLSTSSRRSRNREEAEIPTFRGKGREEVRKLCFLELVILVGVGLGVQNGDRCLVIQLVTEVKTMFV